METEFKIGDKVRVVRNCNRYLPMPPGTLGKEGKIVGSLTPLSCRVKIAYGEEVWVEFREIELVKASKEAPVATKAPAKRKRKS
jgi:hypothetical protein